MLTWSDWRTEMRSNRYHYATRFAQFLPVYFVQPDLEKEEYQLEDSGHTNITLVHVYKDYDVARDRLLATALNETGSRRPLIWAYNSTFDTFVSRIKSPLKIYHATENYFDPHFFAPSESEQTRVEILQSLRAVTAECDGVISVSEAVSRNYEANMPLGAPLTVVNNACDFAFFDSSPTANTEKEINVAIYQGNISSKVDFAMLAEVITMLPSWEFRFAGKVSDDSESAFACLRQLPNVRYVGCLSVEQLAVEMKGATAGIIPFEAKSIWTSSYPLKALEYVACGLPVISTPIDALVEHHKVIEFASTAVDFAARIEEAREKRHDSQLLALRRSIAAENSYDARFDQAVRWMADLAARCNQRIEWPGNASALVLYDHYSTHVGTIREHLEAFPAHSSGTDYYYCPATFKSEALRRDVVHSFDAVIVHYCVRVCFPGHLAPGWTEELAIYRGLKILFIQDEYDNIEITRRFIEQAGIDVVYTCVPDSERHKVYDPARFPNVRFINCLTGYVGGDFKFKARDLNLPPPSQRTNVFAYRGRRLPYYYGTLGEEKREIGDFMKRYCETRGIAANIETDDSRRIYGDDWWRFLGGSRATLASESGSNLFDQEGELRAMIATYLEEHPNAKYPEVRLALHPHLEETVRMNQVSPKVFEAIATRTALVLFEGDYSGVVQPHLHYIPLKKDFSNVEEVMSKVLDDKFVDEMTHRAYEDIILSGAFSAEGFFQSFGALLNHTIRPKTRRTLPLGDGLLSPSLVTSTPLSKNQAENLAARMRSSNPLVLKAEKTALTREVERLNEYYIPEIARLNELIVTSANHYTSEIARLSQSVMKNKERGEHYRKKYKDLKKLKKLKGGDPSSKRKKKLLSRIASWFRRRE